MRKDDSYVGLIVKSKLKKVEEESGINVAQFMTNVTDFYKTCIDYLQLWIQQYNSFQIFEWVLLKHIPRWEEVELSILHIHDCNKQ